jgi:hypothetical protein
MSEITIAQSLQRVLQGMTLFADADVVINDWGVLDGPNAAAPYVIIETADDFTLTDIAAAPRATWNIPFTLVERFTDWDNAKSALMTDRDSILAVLENVAAIDGATNNALAWGLRAIRNDGPIAGIYDRYPSDDREALPAFLSQRLIAVVDEERN